MFLNSYWILQNVLIYFTQNITKIRKFGFICSLFLDSYSCLTESTALADISIVLLSVCFNNYFPKVCSYFCLWNISSLNFILCPTGYFQRSFWWTSTIYVSPLWINIYSDLECIAKNGSGFFFPTQLPDHMEVKNTQLKYSAKGIDLQDHYHFTKHLWTELMCSITGD